jgi:Predicted membrane protein (DUF2306)
MSEYPKHIQDLQDSFVALRLMVRATDAYNRPGPAVIRGTGIAFILRLPFILQEETKRTRLLATSPRSTFDNLWKLVGNVSALFVFPAFAVLHLGGLKVLTFGFFLHVSTGCLYLVTGGLQYYAPLRQRYPKVRRYLGYIHYLMVLLTAVGISMIAVKPHSGFPTLMAILTFLPPWVVVNILAFRAIFFAKK